MPNLLRSKVFIFIVLILAAYFPSGNPYIPAPEKATAATFTMQTGYYIGDGTDNRAITNIGIAPDLVILKDDTAAGGEGVLWKSSAMSGETTAKLGEAEADVATNHIQSLDSNGFTIGTDDDVNSSQVHHYWMAFSGSDCSSSGTFCVGSYSGNGSSQSVNIGFQPDLVVVKRSGTSNGVWKTSSMGANDSNYFAASGQDTGGQMIQGLTSTGFNIGNNATVNTSSNTYWYFAFKEVSGAMDVGVYTGNGTDNRNITSSDDAGLTFQINAIFSKSTHSTTPTAAVFNISEHYGDRSFLATDSASATNHFQLLPASGGFQVGSSTSVNTSGNTIYYAAFGGAASHSSTGTFQLANGSYTGNGTSQSITGLSFKPDLVIVKHNDQATDQFAVFRTKDMKGDMTAYFASATANFTTGITALNSDGFSVGAHATVNTSGDTYYWTAFGNAWDYEDHSGAADFVVGSYIGTLQDNNPINRLPIQPDMVTIKRNGTSLGTWSTSNLASDTSIYFSATAQTTNRIQAFNSDGFELGNNAEVASSGATNFYFAFKSGSSFTVNSYTGNGSTRDITSAGFQPDLIWIKKAASGTNRAGYLRSSAQSGNAAQPFTASPTLSGAITAIISNGFSLGTSAEVNENTFDFRYAAWRIPPSGTLTVDIVDAGGSTVGSPSVSFTTGETTFDCTQTTGTFGVSAQRIRVTNTTVSPAWSLSLAATGGATSNWSSGGANYDFNDSSGSPAGCADGGDADALAGRLSLEFNGGTITPEGGCSATGVTFGSNAGFTQGSVDSITLVSASGSADTDCYWDITDIDLLQRIPAEQAPGTYSISMTLTVVAI